MWVAQHGLARDGFCLQTNALNRCPNMGKISYQGIKINYGLSRLLIKNAIDNTAVGFKRLLEVVNVAFAIQS